MKRIVVLSLMSCALITACSSSRESERDRNAVRNPGRFGWQGEESGEPSRRTSTTTTTTTTETPAPDSTRSTDSTPPSPRPQPTPQATPQPPRGKLPYGIQVPGQPGMVKSPYAPDAGHIDVTGFAPGQPAIDPFTGKQFLVP